MYIRDKLLKIFLLSLLTLNLNAEVYNILKNSGFESDKSSWESYGKVSKITSDSHSGQKAISFKTAGVGQTTDLLPNLDSIDGKSNYILDGYFKHIGNVEGMWIGVVYFDSNWNTIGEDSKEVAISRSYKKFEMLLTPPKGTNYMNFWAWSDGGETHLDDIRLYPKSYTPKPCKLLQNGDFENSRDGWSIYSLSHNIIDGGYNSKKAIKIREGGLDQSISILSNSQNSYQFSGYYRSEKLPEGAWVGMEFYDKDGKLLISKTIELKLSKDYQKFTISATSDKKVSSVQVWIWTDQGKNRGDIILDKLSVTPNSCIEYVAPSTLPPHNMPIDKSPQFVVIGFDDNTISEGIYWAIDLFKSRKNHDNSEALASFYLNSAGLDYYIEDEPNDLLNAFKALKNSTHEIANHTYDHHSGLDESQIVRLGLNSWEKSIKDCELKLKSSIALNKKMVGFRAPYLLYNQNSLEVISSRGYIYDCSIEEGYDSQFNGKNFRWPYQLNGGSPGHNESWYSNPENPNSISIKGVNGLWELPVYVLMVPKDSECEAYGIESGLWSRIKSKMPYLSDRKITSFDYNLWNLAELNKDEVLGILKYNLDLRLAGNRAPFTFGAHTQYYTDAWSNNAPNATTSQMRAAIREFIDYALSKPEVRVTTAQKVIEWCNNPIPLPDK